MIIIIELIFPLVVKDICQYKILIKVKNITAETELPAPGNNTLIPCVRLHYIYNMYSNLIFLPFIACSITESYIYISK